MTTIINRTALLIIGLCTLWTLGGCAMDRDLTGDWASVAELEGYSDVMEIDDDGTGTATIYLYYDGQLAYIEYALEVTSSTMDGTTPVYEIEFENPESEYNFSLECESNEAKDELGCDASGFWSDYEFEWVKV